MKKWQIAISILLVFALGTAAGAYGSRVMFKEKIRKALRTEEPAGVQFIRGMMGRLDLSETQGASISAILDEYYKKSVILHEEYDPQINELFKTVIEETKKVLTDQQWEEIEQMSAKVQGRRRNYSRPRSSAPPEGSVPPEGSTSPESSQPPHSPVQPEASGPPRQFGQKSDESRTAGIIEQLQIPEEKSAEVQSIIEADLKRQQMLGDELEKSQASAEEKFQKEMAEIQAATEKKLAGLLTPEQMKTYKRMMNPEEPRPENFGGDFGFDVPGDAMQPKDFNQGDPPVRPEGQPGSTQGQGPPPTNKAQGSRSI